MVYTLIGVGKLEDKIWSHIMVLVFLILVPVCAGYIDCRISCRRCHENKEHPSVLEVYCAMCAECKQRRREKLFRRNFTTILVTSSKPIGRMNEIDSSESKKQSTPTAAVKQTISRTHKPLILRQLQKLHSIRQTPKRIQASKPNSILRNSGPFLIGWPEGCPTPPTCADSEENAQNLYYRTTDIPDNPGPTSCPAIPPCRKKNKKKENVMATCIPCMPMCPCPEYFTQNTPMALKEGETTTPPPKEYHYVYVGLPIDVLRKG